MYNEELCQNTTLIYPKQEFPRVSISRAHTTFIVPHQRKKSKVKYFLKE